MKQVRLLSCIAVLPLTAITSAAAAQERVAEGGRAEAALPEPAPTGAGDDPPPGNEIVVVATRMPGSLVVPQTPVTTLSEDDVQSYGVSSVAELLDAIAPETTSGRGRGAGRPVILVNGQRIANFREMRNFATEAIRRVEVFPEEVALRYGYPPNQRVINFILKDDFASRTVEASYSQPDRGGTSTSKGEGSLLRIDGPRRLNLTANYAHTSPLTEAERGVIQAGPPIVSGDADPAEYRTLVARSTSYGANATWSTGLGSGPGSGSLSLNGAVSRARTLSFSGLDSRLTTLPDGRLAQDTFGDPLARRTDTSTLEGGATLNKPLGSWQLTATADADHAVTTSLVDRRTGGGAEAGTDRAHTTSDSATGLVTLIGRPLHLPAGDLAATMKVGYAWSRIASDDTRTVARPTRLARGDLSAGINLGIPIASARENALAWLGSLTLNLSAGVNRLSDFGTLADWSAGLTWSPTERLTLGASYIVDQAAPSLTDLGNPQVLTFNVPVWDFGRGRTSLVTLTGGGNPGLLRETRRDIKLSANWQLPFPGSSGLSVEYFRNRSRNVTAPFPLLTPAIECAFPDRVTRDAAGGLVSIDQRPVTFYGTSASRLRYGISLRGNLGKPQPGGRGGRRGEFAGPPPGGMAGGFGRGGRGGGRGRWNLSLYHTVQFTDRVVVVPGGPVLDLLGGDALTGGGVARHTLELDAGGFYRGFGLRFAGSYAAPTTVRASGAPGSSDLRFGGLFKLDTRAFVDLGQQKRLTDASSLFRGARLSLFVNNLFDARQRVTDAGGTVPIPYQADLIDPLGRVVGVEFRKMF